MRLLVSLLTRQHKAPPWRRIVSVGSAWPTDMPQAGEMEGVAIVMIIAAIKLGKQIVLFLSL